MPDASTATAAPGDSATPELMKAISAAFNSRDVDRIVSFFTDDATFWLARGPEPVGRTLKGKETIRKALADRFKVIPDMRWDHKEYIFAGNRAVSVAAKVRSGTGVITLTTAPLMALGWRTDEILASGIEDDKKNFTRFFLVRRKRAVLSGANKTSIAFRLKNVPGALYKALSVFALRDISLSKIESRPMRGRPWEYVFYTDFLRGDDSVSRNALNHLGEVADLVKVLGIYPAA